MSRPVADPFMWQDNDEDQLRAACTCGWRGEWHDYVKQVRADEKDHACERAARWREARSK